MKKKTHYMVDRPLADMHGDGVRFNQQIKQAMINQRANRLEENNNAAIKE
jgi:hypothetical protein